MKDLKTPTVRGSTGLDGLDPPGWSTREEWEALKRYILTGGIVVMGALFYVIMIPIRIIEVLH